VAALVLLRRVTTHHTLDLRADPVAVAIGVIDDRSGCDWDQGRRPNSAPTWGMWQLAPHSAPSVNGPRRRGLRIPDALRRICR